MLLCPRYMECKAPFDCIHKVPHMEDSDCTNYSCDYTKGSKILCIEEFYVYMKEAIDE